MDQKTDSTLEPTAADINRFWTKVDRRGPDECWPWIAARDARGYGQFAIYKKSARRSLKAHRVSYLITAGSVSDGLFVCHECDVPACCNPNHLYAGTYQDNIDDKVRKQRQWRGRGESSGTAKLTETQVLAIRGLVATGLVSQKHIAKRFNVSRASVHDIATRRRWKHI